jgi:translation elongation factor EF-Tu-like GTPase
MTRRVVRAVVELLPTNRGGRSSAIQSGYRSLARFEGSTLDLGFELQLDDRSIGPGDSGVGRLSFWAVGDVPDISEGRPFELREGSRVVGNGTVLDPDCG